MTSESTVQAVDRMRRHVSIIQRVAAEHFEIPFHHFTSRKRHEPLATQRQIAMALCDDMTEASQTDIATAFCRGSHGTVAHAIAAIQGKQLTDPSVHANYHAIRDKLLPLLTP